jgi:hypothetical protein
VFSSPLLSPRLIPFRDADKSLPTAGLYSGGSSFIIDASDAGRAAKSSAGIMKDEVLWRVPPCAKYACEES